mgnify:CR=1 FL=1
MRLTDTHSHLYAPEFDADREEALARAADAGVERVLLPAIDSESHERLFGLCRSHPERCAPMMGLHPTSVNDNPRWREELALVERYLETPPAGIRFCAVGEIGLDLYWSRDFRAEQLEAFRRHIGIRYAQLELDERETLQRDYRERMYRLGERHTFRYPDGTPTEASIEGVRPTGELLLRHADGTLREYLFKEIEFVIAGK